MRLALALALAVADCSGSATPDPSPSPSGPISSFVPDPDQPTHTLAGNRVAIVTPANDTIQLSAQLALSGEVSPAGSAVTLAVVRETRSLMLAEGLPDAPP